MGNDDKQWHLSRNVPIAMIFAIFLQTIFFATWLQGMRSDVDHNIQEINALKNGRNGKVDKEVMEQMFIVRDTKIHNMAEDLHELKESNKEILKQLQQLNARLQNNEN